MLSRLVKSMYVPFLLVLYALIWITLQPIIMKGMIYIENRFFRYSIYTQVLVTVTYIVINVLWLISWYCIARYVRGKVIRRMRNS